MIRRQDSIKTAMNSRAKVGIVLVVLVAIGAIFQLQQIKIKRLVAQNIDLRSRLAQMASLQEANEHLAEQVKSIGEVSLANETELMRLRGRGTRLRELEQENTALKAQRQNLERQMQQAQSTIASEQPKVAPASDVKLANGIPSANTTDLGTLEVSADTSTQFDLGGGTNCIITPTKTPDGNVTMDIKLAMADANGTTTELSASRLTARPDQHCFISVGDRMIGLAIKIKP